MNDAADAPPPLPPAEPRFRWRGGDGSRLEAVGDAVFALALTMLLLSSEVPTRTSQLWIVLQEAVPFGITFAIIAMIWFAHFLFFRRYGLRDRLCVTLNFLLLFLVLLYVYPLKFVFSLVAVVVFGFDGIDVVVDDQAFNLMAFYGLGFAAIYLTLTALYLHAWRLRDALALNALERSITLQWITMHVAMVVIGIVSAGIAFAGAGPAAGLSYFAIGPAMGVLSYVFEVRRERLTQQATNR